MSWVYVNSEPDLWTVGFYKPGGAFVPDSDHTSRGDAAARVHYLNGGEAACPDVLHALADMVELYNALAAKPAHAPAYHAACRVLAAHAIYRKQPTQTEPHDKSQK